MPKIKSGVTADLALPRLANLAPKTQDLLSERAPDIAANDSLLLLVTPGFPCLSWHTRLERMADLPRQASLLMQAMGIPTAFAIQPLVV